MKMLNLNVDEVVKLVDELFNEYVSSDAFESVLGLESEVVGKEEFLKNLRKRLNEK